MKTRACVSVLLMASCSLAAHAAVKGQCVYGGKTLVFVDAYAALGPDPFEEKKKVPMLWLTTTALDRAALASAKADDIDDAVDGQAFDHDGARLELRFDAGGTTVEGLQFYAPPGSNRSISGNKVGEVKLKAAMTTRATGHFALSDDDDLKCNVEFDVPLGGSGPPPPPAKLWGAALPPGGGEPGMAYLAMHRATLARDIDAMLKLATKARADEMRKARSQPEFPKMLEMIKAFEPTQTRVVSGRADATRAELQIAGKDSDGSTMTGEVKLVLESGTWKIEKVSTKSKMGQ